MLDCSRGGPYQPHRSLTPIVTVLLDCSHFNRLIVTGLLPITALQQVPLQGSSRPWCFNTTHVSIPLVWSNFHTDISFVPLADPQVKPWLARTKRRPQSCQKWDLYLIPTIWIPPGKARSHCFPKCFSINPSSFLILRLCILYALIWTHTAMFDNKTWMEDISLSLCDCWGRSQDQTLFHGLEPWLRLQWLWFCRFWVSKCCKQCLS